MIAVIADDLTGAAEIGGVAFRQGYRSIIRTSFTDIDSDVDTDVLIVASNTRSKPPEEARRIINALMLQLLKLAPDFIYKKIDSVLRGNVGEELFEQLKVCSMKRALIIPPNPSLNRIIKDGIYYYNGRPLNSHKFLPGSPTESKSSSVIELIGAKSADQTFIISKGMPLPMEGLIVGNTTDESDLDHWASEKDNQTVLAGGSSFFNAILKNIKLHLGLHSVNKSEIGNPRLFVCGSAFSASRNVVKAAHKEGEFVAHMPSDLFCTHADRDSLVASWVDRIMAGMQMSGTVIIAVDEIQSSSIENLSEKICDAFADVVKQVHDRITLKELFIEGGATSSAILTSLNYDTFFPVQELALGVIRMKVERNDNLFITLKPGSYDWPASIWNYKT